MATELGPDGIVVDIGRALDALKATLAPINYVNLDTLEMFEGEVTTVHPLGGCAMAESTDTGVVDARME